MAQFASNSLPKKPKRTLHVPVEKSGSLEDISRIQEIANQGATDIPNLECLIIPSFGKHPPGVNVAMKRKAQGDFLQGVGDDMKRIQGLLGKDKKKELRQVEVLCHFMQKKVGVLRSTIEEGMKDLKMNNQKGLLIWYTGHGETKTGNWVLEDGCLSFADIYSLYKKFFKGRYLYIVTDCCFSGSWVEECARLLDEDGFRCGRSAKNNQVLIKVFASCLPAEPAIDKFYTECLGVKLYSQDGGRDPHNRSVVFAEHRKLERSPCPDSQTTFGMDFTQTNRCIDDECAHCPTWTALVQQLKREECSKQYLI